MSIPLYQNVYFKLRDDINTGKYAPGSTIPSERKLGELFAVSQITVRRAINELVVDGLILKRQGIGNVVRNPVSELQIEMQGFTAEVEAGRLKLVRTLLVDDLAPASEGVARKLGVQSGSMLRHLVRLDIEGGLPLSVDEVFIKPSLANSITPEMASSTLFFYLWQAASKTQVVSVKYEISVQMPDEREQDVLHIGPDLPLLVAGQLEFDKEGQPSAWIESRYRSDRCRLTVSARRVPRVTDKGIVGE